MESVLDVVRKIAGEEALRDLEDELKGILHCIAHDNKYEDIKWIKDRQKYLNQKYGDFMGKMNLNLFGYPADFIRDAYGEFLDLLDGSPPSEDILVEANDILGQYLELSFVLRLDVDEVEEVLNLSEVPFPKYK